MSAHLSSLPALLLPFSEVVHSKRWFLDFISPEFYVRLFAIPPSGLELLAQLPPDVLIARNWDRLPVALSPSTLPRVFSDSTLEL